MTKGKISKVVVIINGRPTSGKDTMCNFLISSYGEDLVESISSVDKIKSVATILGWDGIKNPDSRKFLSDLKNLSTEYNDNPFTSIVDHIKLSTRNIIFVHIREIYEIEKLKNFINSEDSSIWCTTLKINRPVSSLSNNTGDMGADDIYDYDYEIYNNAGLEVFQEAAEEFGYTIFDEYFN
jgi:hypothetical protein